MGTYKDLKKGEFLDYDNRAYNMLHRTTTEWPCLSCDILLPSDHNESIYSSFQKMDDYPYTVYVVAGT